MTVMLTMATAAATVTTVARLTFEIVSAGDHWSFRMSKQMPPLDCELGSG